MSDFALRRNGSTGLRNRIGGLAIWVSMLGLRVGSAAAETNPTESAAVAARTLLGQRLPKKLGLVLAPRDFCPDKPDQACTLEGDFDGDDKPDQAVLVQDKKCTERAPVCLQVGIAFLFGSGKVEVIGVGKGRWQKVDEQTGRPGPEKALLAQDFTLEEAKRWSWRVWRLTAEGLRPLTGKGPRPSGRPPGMRRDAVEISGGDASILVYRTAQGWIQYDLGY